MYPDVKYEALNEASGNNQMNTVKYLIVDQGLIPTFDSAKKAITSGSVLEEMVKFLTRCKYRLTKNITFIEFII